jgi:hypothetical protein
VRGRGAVSFMKRLRRRALRALAFGAVFVSCRCGRFVLTPSALGFSCRLGLSVSCRCCSGRSSWSWSSRSGSCRLGLTVLSVFGSLLFISFWLLCLCSVWSRSGSCRLGLTVLSVFGSLLFISFWLLCLCSVWSRSGSCRLGLTVLSVFGSLLFISFWLLCLVPDAAVRACRVVLFSGVVSPGSCRRVWFVSAPWVPEGSSTATPPMFTLHTQPPTPRHIAHPSHATTTPPAHQPSTLIHPNHNQPNPTKTQHTTPTKPHKTQPQQAGNHPSHPQNPFRRNEGRGKSACSCTGRYPQNLSQPRKTTSVRRLAPFCAA